MDLSRTGDYLHKITKLMLGCGFGIAIFSSETPAKTLGNIFFEIGYCLAIGKPVIFIISGGRQSVPSDFVRSEWIEYNEGQETEFEANLKAAILGLSEQSQFYELLAQTAYDAEEIDPEMIIERYKRSALINGNNHSLQRLKDIERLIRSQKVPELLRPYKKGLLENVKQFLRFF